MARTPTAEQQLDDRKRMEARKQSTCPRCSQEIYPGQEIHLTRLKGHRRARFTHVGCKGTTRSKPRKAPKRKASGGPKAPLPETQDPALAARLAEAEARAELAQERVESLRKENDQLRQAVRRLIREKQAVTA